MNKKKKNLITAVILILFMWVWGRITQFNIETDPTVITTFLTVNTILNIIGTVWVYNIAKRLNRNALSWSIFAFFVLPIVLIIIGFLRKRGIVDE